MPTDDQSFEYAVYAVISLSIAYNMFATMQFGPQEREAAIGAIRVGLFVATIVGCNEAAKLMYAHGVRLQIFDRICATQAVGALVLAAYDMGYLAYGAAGASALFMTFGYHRVIVATNVVYLLNDYDAMCYTRTRFAAFVYTKTKLFVIETAHPFFRDVVAPRWWQILLTWFVVQMVWNYRDRAYEIVLHAIEAIHPYLKWVVERIGEALSLLRELAIQALKSVADWAIYAIEGLIDAVKTCVGWMFDRFAWIREILVAMWDATAAIREMFRDAFAKIWAQLGVVLAYVRDAFEWIATKIWFALCELVKPSPKTMAAVTCVLVAEWGRRQWFKI